MEEIFGIIIIRDLVRWIGKYCRYFFYKLIRKNVTLKELSNNYKKDSEYPNAVNQDISNAIIGTIVFIIISCVIAYLVFK